MSGAGPGIPETIGLLSGLSQFRSLNDLAVETARMWGAEPSAPVSTGLAEGLERGLHDWLQGELPRDLAKHVFTRLTAASGIMPRQTLSNYLCWRALLYLQMLVPWVSLWVAFVYASLAVCRHRKVNDIFVLGRDALLFYPAALRLTRKLRWRLRVIPLNLNRRLLGLDDAPEPGTGAVTVDRPQHDDDTLADYLNDALHPPRSIALVDSGYYGTIPWYLLQRSRIQVDVLALYFSSRNPNLFGFMNTLAGFGNIKAVVVPYEFVVRAGDTVEAALKPYKIGGLTRDGGRVVVTGQPAPLLPGFLAVASYWMVSQWAGSLTPGDLDPWQQLLAVYKLSRIRGADGWPVPLILPRTTPKWEMGSRWLKNWDLGPIPPMDDICGPRPG